MRDFVIHKHKLDVLSAVIFILGVIAAFVFLWVVGYALAGGMIFALPNVVIYAPGVAIVLYSVIFVCLLTVITTGLLYYAIKENKHRLLEFSAGLVVAFGGFLLGYFLYWVNKNLFDDKKGTDVSSYMIAFGITFILMLIFVLVVFYVQMPIF